MSVGSTVSMLPWRFQISRHSKQKSLRELSPDSTDIAPLSLRGIVSELPQVLYHGVVGPPVSGPAESELGWVWDLVEQVEPCDVADEAGLHARLLVACANACGAQFRPTGDIRFPSPRPLIKIEVLSGVGLRCPPSRTQGASRPEPSVLLDAVVLLAEARRCRGSRGDE